MKQMRAMYGNRLEENIFLRDLPLTPKQEKARIFAIIISPFEIPGLMLIDTATIPFQLLDFDMPDYPFTTFWIRTVKERNAARIGSLLAEHPMGLRSIPLEKCLESAYMGKREEALKQAEHLLTHASNDNQCYYIVPIRVFLLLGEKEKAIDAIHKYANGVYSWPITSPTDIADMVPLFGVIPAFAAEEAWITMRDAVGMALLFRYIYDRGYADILDSKVMSSIRKINRGMPWQDGLDLTSLEMTALNNEGHYQEALKLGFKGLEQQEKRFEKNGQKDIHDFIVLNFGMATMFVPLPCPLYFKECNRHASTFPPWHSILPDKYTLALCYGEQIRSLCLLGRATEAGTILQKLDNVTKERDWCRWLFLEGQFLHAIYSGNFDLAASIDRQLIADSLGKAQFSRLMQSGKEHGKAFESAGKPDLALKSYEGVIDALDSMYRQAGEDTSFSENFNRQHLPFYEKVIELLVSQKAEPRKILRMAERTKSRILSQLLLARHSEANGIIPEYRNEYQLLQAQHRAQRIQAAVLANTEERKKAQSSVEHIQDKIRRIEQLSGEKGGTRTGLLTRLTEKETEKSFKTSDITLVYWLGEKLSLCFLCTPSGELTMRTLPPRQHFQELISTYRKLLQDPSSDPLKSSDGQKLAAELLPVQIKGRRVLIIPDKELNLLPFEALPVSDEYMVRNTEIAYAPSLSTAIPVDLHQRDPKPEALMFALADPVFKNDDSSKESQGFTTSFQRGGIDLVRLPGTAMETEAIKGVFNDTVLLSGMNATERALRQTNLSRFRYIHFATHGLLGDDTIGPGEPALALAAPSSHDKKNYDGFLSASEIAGLELNADLVTLSGCNTASGKLSKGDGVASLATAFLSAGAHGVVVSTWAVEDKATGELMAIFYKHLSQGHGTVKSLREAKIELMAHKNLGTGKERGMIESNVLDHKTETSQHTGYTHPYYWAPFIYVGTFGER